MDDPILEEKLKNMFENRADELPEDPGREAQIRRNVYGQIEREGNFMRKGIMRKTVVALAAICVLGSMTAFGVGKITGITSHSSSEQKENVKERLIMRYLRAGPGTAKKTRPGGPFSRGILQWLHIFRCCPKVL